MAGKKRQLSSSWVDTDTKLMTSGGLSLTPCTSHAVWINWDVPDPPISSDNGESSVH